MFRLLSNDFGSRANPKFVVGLLSAQAKKGSIQKHTPTWHTMPSNASPAPSYRSDVFQSNVVRLRACCVIHLTTSPLSREHQSTHDPTTQQAQNSIICIYHLSLSLSLPLRPEGLDSARQRNRCPLIFRGTNNILGQPGQLYTRVYIYIYMCTHIVNSID